MQLINDAQEAHALALSPSGEVNLERFAQLLAMRGHHVWLRTGRLDCGCGQVALRHTFVLAGASGMHSVLSFNTTPATHSVLQLATWLLQANCSGWQDASGWTPGPASLLLLLPLLRAGSSGSDLMPQLFVVDPSFKEQFQLPNATPEYSALFQDLPNLFVGTAEQLVPIVELMCTQVCCDETFSQAAAYHEGLAVLQQISLASTLSSAELTGAGTTSSRPGTAAGKYRTAPEQQHVAV